MYTPSQFIHAEIIICNSFASRSYRLITANEI